MAVSAQRGRKIATDPAPCSYNSRLQKGGALFEDMRLLVRNWQEIGVNGRYDEVVAENLLGKHTRARAADVLRYIFLPRFVHGRPLHAWRIVRELEDRTLPVEIARPIYYWITARTERLLYDFVCAELLNRSESYVQRITTADVGRWIASQLATCGKNWSPSVTSRVARGVLAALRDFGLLEGASKKRIAPVYLPTESFAYIAFALHREGVSGPQLVQHRDWQLFLLSPPVVEQMFLEADCSGLLRFQAAGKIVRIDFPAANFGEMADVVAARTH